jgi:curved DNA-binding protein CbpA
MDAGKDYYSDLGVLPDVSKEVIRAVYLALAKRFHPDTGGEHKDEDKFKTISEAYEVLWDDVLRKKYDELRGEQDQSSYNTAANEEEDLEAETYDEEWSFAVEYYPHIEVLRREVSVISSALSLVFQGIILATKSFRTAGEVKVKIVDEFIERYFGSNGEVKAFALHLLKSKEKSAAKELNKSAIIFGSMIEPETVIPHILLKHNLPPWQNGFPLKIDIDQYVEDDGTLAIYERPFGKFVIRDASLDLYPSSPEFSRLEHAREFIEGLSTGAPSLKNGFPAQIYFEKYVEDNGVLAIYEDPSGIYSVRDKSREVCASSSTYHSIEDARRFVENFTAGQYA